MNEQYIKVEPGWDEIKRRFANKLNLLPPKMGAVALKFIDDNFKRQGFANGGISKWPARKDNTDAGRAILVGKGSGHLRRDPRIVRTTPDYVIVGTGLPYARVHNLGGTTHPRVTAKMRGWAWARYMETKSEKYKAIALTKKARLDVKIPKRQFMGVSQTLAKMVKEVIKRELS